jgi:hypothetical protein
MLKIISNFIIRLSRGWVVLLALLIFTAFMIFILPAQSALAAETGGGAGSADTSFFYTTADLYHMAETYGAQGRRAYIHARFTFDLVWPLVYTFFLITTTSWLFGRALSGNSRWLLLNLVPILGMKLDYLENIGASIVMARYPLKTVVIDSLTPIFSLLKWLFVSASFFICLIAAALAVWYWIKSQRH